MITKIFTPVIFCLSLSFTPVVFASTLDEYLTPDELAAELLLPPTETSTPVSPFTPEQILRTYGVDVYSEFPIVIAVSKASQTATVYYEGRVYHNFLISTGREKWETSKSGKRYFTATPSGWYSPKRYVRKHWSETWDALMEYAIFFNGGIAVHATTSDHYNELGSKASGGCVRAHPENAKWFWDLSLSRKKALVPYFTRRGQLVTNRDGSLKRHMASGTLIIVADY